MIRNLFPVALGDYQLDRRVTKKEIAFIKKQKTYKNHGNTTSENHKILDSKTLKAIKDFIVEKTNQYFEEVYRPSGDVRLEITQSWCNYTEPGQYHHKHAHPNSFISGVFYLEADIEKDKIFFYKDQYETLVVPTSDWNLWNSKSWWFEAGTGKLFLFPSSLTHMVPITESDQTRISLSFNTFPVGSLGVDREVTALHIDGAK